MKFEHEWIQATLDGIDVVNTRNAYKHGIVMFWKWYINQGQPDLTLHVMNRFKRFMQDNNFATKTIGIALSAIKLALDTNARPEETKERLDLQDIRQRLTIKTVKSDNYSVRLSVEERDKILATCPCNLMGKRDLAVLTLLFYGGLRRGEIAKLDLKDYDNIHGMLFIREAKHHKDRAIPLHPLVISRIEAWLEIREQIATCSGLFVNVERKSKGMQLSGMNVYNIMTKYCNEAGIAHYHPHDCRSTYITMLHDNHVPVGDIQALAGHSNAQTTMSYVRIDFNNLRKAILTLE